MMHHAFPGHDLILSGCTSSPSGLLVAHLLVMIPHPLEWALFRKLRIWHLPVSTWLREDTCILRYSNDRSAPCLYFDTLFLWHYRLIKPTSYPLKFPRRKYHLFPNSRGNLLNSSKIPLPCITFYFCNWTNIHSGNKIIEFFFFPFPVGLFSSSEWFQCKATSFWHYPSIFTILTDCTKCFYIYTLP